LTQILVETPQHFLQCAITILSQTQYSNNSKPDGHTRERRCGDSEKNGTLRRRGCALALVTIYNKVLLVSISLYIS